MQLYRLKIIKVFKHDIFHESMTNELFKNCLLDKMFKSFMSSKAKFSNFLAILAMTFCAYLS
jgi:hypothetical protein